MIDSESGDPIALSSLGKGDEITAYYSPMLEMSEPAQSAAFALVTNLLGRRCARIIFDRRGGYAN